MRTEEEIRKMIASLDGVIEAFKGTKVRVDKMITARTVLEWVLEDGAKKGN